MLFQMLDILRVTKIEDPAGSTSQCGNYEKSTQRSQVLYPKKIQTKGHFSDKSPNEANSVQWWTACQPPKGQFFGQALMAQCRVGTTWHHQPSHYDNWKSTRMHSYLTMTSPANYGFNAPTIYLGALNPEGELRKKKGEEP